MKKKKTASRNNIWNKHDFKMNGLGEKLKIIGVVKHFGRCIRWSLQRITRGYADCDRWSMYTYLQFLMADMLQDMHDNRHGSPGYLGKNYTNEQGILVNDTCHDEWDKILERMVFLWKESNEDTCTRTNPYEEEYIAAFSEFYEKYGLLGEKLRTKKELAENNKQGVITGHFMDELPEYKEISEKYRAEDAMIDEYRAQCKDEALDLLKKHFYDLWD